MAKAKLKLPKGVRFQKYVLKETGQIVRYGYYGRGEGAVPLGRADEPAFFERLAEALKREPKANTVEFLASQYKQSVEFRRLQPRTQSDYRLFLDKVVGRFGALSLRAMGDRLMSGYIYQWRDSMEASPRRADYAVAVLKALLSWGVKRGFLEINRAAGVGRIHSSDRRDITWSDAQIEAFLKVASDPLKKAMILALETGQRQADLLILGWSSITDNVIELRQRKTNRAVAIPLSERLQAMLGGIERRDATTILTKADGLPWDPKGNGFRAAWRDACAAAGVKGVTFHDLRGTFVTRRLAEGWTPMEVAICTGHSVRDLSMLDVYADRAAIAKATALRVGNGKRNV